MRKSLFPLVVVILMLGSCNNTSEPSNASTSTAITSIPPSTAAEPVPAMFTGRFAIANTTEGGGEVGVTAISLTVRVDETGHGDWETIDAECTTEPSPQFIVNERQEVEFVCDAETSLSAGTRYEIAGIVDLFGSDTPYEFVVSGVVGQD